MTDASKNITSPQNPFVGGKNAQIILFFLKLISGHTYFLTSWHHQCLNNWTYTNKCRQLCYVVLCNRVLLRCVEGPRHVNSRNESKRWRHYAKYSSRCRKECHQFWTSIICKGDFLCYEITPHYGTKFITNRFQKNYMLIFASKF